MNEEVREKLKIESRKRTCFKCGERRETKPVMKKDGVKITCGNCGYDFK